MIKRPGAWVYIFPILHVLFIGLMLTWHFQNVDFFGHVTDQLSLRGSLQITPRGAPGISQLDIQYEGLNFPFFNRTAVRVVDPGQDTRRLRVTGYNTSEDGFSVLFNEGFRIEFITEENNELRIVPTIPETLQPVSELIIPVQLLEGVEVEQTDNLAVLSLQYENNVYLLTLPPRTVLNAERGTLTLPGNVGRQTIRYIRTEQQPRIAETPDDDSEAVSDTGPWYEAEDIRVSLQAYTSEIESFVDSAYTGWSETRFNPGTGTWEQPGGSAEFREATLIAYLAASWNRDSYTTVYNEMRTAAGRHPERIGYDSSVYLGNMREQREKQERADAELTGSLLSAINSGDTRPLQDNDFIEWVLLRGSQELLDAVPAYIRDISLDSLSAAGLVGFLENSLYSDPMPEPLRTALDQKQPLVVDLLMERLTRIDSAIYLETSSGQSELLTTVRAGRALEQYGSRQDQEQLVGIGRRMVISALSDRDSLGFLPELLLLSGDEIIGREGQLAPEDVHVYIHRDAAYPRMVSLYDELGQGSYIYTAARFPQIEYDQQQLELNIESPRNRTHYLYVHGLPRYRVLQLFGFQWPADASFENYSRGTYYHESSETAMIKYYEDAVSSEIIYQF